MELNENWLARVVLLALEEDIGLGDITTQATVPRDVLGRARIWAKEEGVIAGLPVAEAVFC